MNMKSDQQKKIKHVIEKLCLETAKTTSDAICTRISQIIAARLLNSTNEDKKAELRAVLKLVSDLQENEVNEQLNKFFLELSIEGLLKEACGPDN